MISNSGGGGGALGLGGSTAFASIRRASTASAQRISSRFGGVAAGTSVPAMPLADASNRPLWQHQHAASAAACGEDGARGQVSSAFTRGSDHRPPSASSGLDSAVFAPVVLSSSGVGHNGGAHSPRSLHSGLSERDTVAATLTPRIAAASADLFNTPLPPAPRSVSSHSLRNAGDAHQSSGSGSGSGSLRAPAPAPTACEAPASASVPLAMMPPLAPRAGAQSAFGRPIAPLTLASHAPDAFDEREHGASAAALPRPASASSVPVDGHAARSASRPRSASMGDLPVGASASSGRSVPATTDARVTVVVRVRPPIDEDWNNALGVPFQDCTSIVGERQMTVAKWSNEHKLFQFDRVLGPTSTQADTYTAVASDVVEDVMRGVNGTILAYGQTGSGKTHTIFGAAGCFAGVSSAGGSGRSTPVSTREDWGVVPRAVHHLFNSIEQNGRTTEFRVTVSFLQIYLENVHDLLEPSRGNLAIREDPRTGIYVDGLLQVVVQSAADVMKLFNEGARNRSIATTLMNKTSSRSHVLALIAVEQRARGAQPTDGAAVKRGVLTIVDLAGSERVSKSCSDGVRLEEAKTINRSLCALGNCVAALTDRSVTHVPYRDSKLTRLLTESLGGNSRTSLIVNVGPALYNFDETYNALLFAQRCMNVQNAARVNEAADFRVLYGRLMALEDGASETSAPSSRPGSAHGDRRSSLGAAPTGGAGQGDAVRDGGVADAMRRMQAQILQYQTHADRMQSDLAQLRVRLGSARDGAPARHPAAAVAAAAALAAAATDGFPVTDGEGSTRAVDGGAAGALDALVDALLDNEFVRDRIMERLAFRMQRFA